MKLFQYIISPAFCNFSLKTLTKDSSYKWYNAGKKCFSYNHRPRAYLNIRKFHTTSYLADDFFASQPKKRLQRKKLQKWQENGPTWSAVAYSSAQEYHMKDLTERLMSQGVYQHVPLPKDAGDNLHLYFKEESSEPSHIYIFSEGSIVFWNVPEPKQVEILNSLKPYEINPYDPEIVKNEKEDLDYTFSEDETRFIRGLVILNSKTNTDLFTYTFSNSLVQSVKLGISEATLEKFISSIRWVPEKMAKGENINISSRQILAKRGELFALRDNTSLSSNLSDTPDFYWDRIHLETLYHHTCNYLDIPKRIKSINERLGYCSELVDLLVNHMNDKHHVRLEWNIIALIMVEVLFECIHFLQHYID